MLLTPSFPFPVSPDPTLIPSPLPGAPAGGAMPADPLQLGAVQDDFAALFAGLTSEPKPQLPAPAANLAPRFDGWTTGEASRPADPRAVEFPAEVAEPAAESVPCETTVPAITSVFVSASAPQVAESLLVRAPRRADPAVRRSDDVPSAPAESDSPEAPLTGLPTEALAAALAFAGLPLSPSVEPETAEIPEAPKDADATADEEAETSDPDRTVGAKPISSSTSAPTPRPAADLGFAKVDGNALREPAAAPARGPVARPTNLATIEFETMPVSTSTPTPLPDASVGFAMVDGIAVRESVAAPARGPVARLTTPATIEFETRPVPPVEAVAPALAAESGDRVEIPASAAEYGDRAEMSATEAAPVATKSRVDSPMEALRPRIDAAATVPLAKPLPTPVATLATAASRPVFQGAAEPTPERPMPPDSVAPAISPSRSVALPEPAFARSAVQLRSVAVTRPVEGWRAEAVPAAPVAVERDSAPDSLTAEPHVTSSSRLAAWTPASVAPALPTVSANIAAPVRATARPVSITAEVEFKHFVTANEQELTDRHESIGIAVAKLPAIMPPALAAAPDVHPTFEYAGAWAVAPAPEFAVAATPAGLSTAETDMPRTAHRAVESALATVDRLADAPRQSVELDFSVGDVALAVRVELRGEEVRATFRTDSPELRAALAQEWQSAAASQQGERAVRFAAPVISGSDQPPAQGFGGDPAFSQQQGRHMRHGGTDTPQFAGGSVRPAAPSAPSASAPAAAAAPVSAPGSRRLNRFA